RLMPGFRPNRSAPSAGAPSRKSVQIAVSQWPLTPRPRRADWMSMARSDEQPDAGVDLVNAMGFLRPFYNAPGQRLRADDAIRAAAAAGLSPQAVARFYAGVHAPLRREGEWHLLTST